MPKHRKRRSPAAKPTVAHLPWTDQRKDMVRRLWLENMTSGEIARTIGNTTRDAIMGMVNRLGLLGKGGQRQPPRRVPPAQAAIHTLVSDLFGREASPKITGHSEAMVILATAALGSRDRDAVCYRTGLPPRRIDAIYSRMDALGIWDESSQAPSSWSEDSTNDVALLIDCLRISGFISDPPSAATLPLAA